AVLDNDSDPDNDALEVTTTTAPTNGSVVINQGGTVTYTPNNNFNGTDSFSYTITDGNGGTDTAMVTVTVGATNDAPVAVDDSANTDQDTSVSIAILENDSDIDGDQLTIIEVTEPDNGSVIINEDETITYTPNNSFTGVQTLEYIISDGNGGTDTASINITVNDTEGPEIMCPDNINVSVDTEVCGAIVEFTIPEFSDNSGSATIEQIKGMASGSFFPVGSTAITFVATDQAGNSTTCNYNVIVTDDEAPVIEEKNDITVNTDSDSCYAIVDFDIPSVTDNCGIDTMELTNGLEPGSEFPVGKTNITYTVKDTNGNTATENFTITVIDNEAPAIACPKDIIVSTQANEAYALVNFENPSATDNCEVTVEQTGGPVSGSQFPIGITTITFTATDNAGNTTQCSFSISIKDTEDPTLACPKDISTGVDNGICGAVIEFENPKGFDNSGEVSVEQTAGPESGELFAVGITTITFTATDPAGNTAICSFDINVNDDQAPVIEERDNITVNTDPGICGAIVNFDIPSATDNCGIETVELAGGLEPGSEFPVGTTTVNYKVTDIHGNSAISSFNVTVIDNEAPIITCPENISLNVEFGTETVLVNYNAISNTDNCTETSIELIEGFASGEEFPIGETKITYKVTDAAGNSATCTFKVNVIEDPEEIPSAPNAPQVDIIQPDCITPTGVILINTEEGLSYSIDGENYEATGEFTDLEPGTYEVTARDEFDQISEAIVVILEEPVVNEIGTSTTSLCTEDSTFDLFELLEGEYDNSGIWIDTNETGALNQSFIDPSLLQVGTYTFEYQIENGICTSSTTVSLSINDDCVVLPCSLEDIESSISKAVTPNGDNYNDYFTIDFASECGFTYDIKIFNRWGNKVYETTNYQNNWNGYSTNSITSSNQLPSGTYFYILEIRNSGFDPIQGYIYLGTK
ncbi:gliding motility-associated-like protein, partial [Salegentibacter sp. 24]|uniref:HYR domain-containing protein n=1 Tax=Salegentibacter sp. 24 TaxID=2183986 RepID=UPI00105B5D8B